MTVRLSQDARLHSKRLWYSICLKMQNMKEPRNVYYRTMCPYLFILCVIQNIQFSRDRWITVTVIQQTPALQSIYLPVHPESIAMQIGICVIVQQTITDNELKVCSERIKCSIAVTVNLLAHSAQVHRMTDFVQVVYNLTTVTTKLPTRNILATE